MPQTLSQHTPGLPLDTWLVQAEGLSVVRLTFKVQATEQTRLRHPCNVVLRGTMGRHLRAMRCLTGATSCEGCEVWTDCDYANLFRHRERSGQKRLSAAWRLRGGSLERFIPKGKRLQVIVEIDEHEAAALPWVQVAMRQAIFQVFGSESIVEEPMTEVRRFAPSSDASQAPIVHGLYLLSPCDVGRIRPADRRDCPNVPIFSRLMRGTVRRVAGRMDAANKRFEPVNYPSLQSIRLANNTFELWRDTRYSYRQRKELKMTGVMGMLQFSEALSPDLSLLCHAMEFFGVGSDLVLGFGDIETIEENTPARRVRSDSPRDSIGS